MSAMDKGEKKQFTHIGAILSLRGSCLDKQDEEQTPTVLQVKKNWTRSILTAYYWRKSGRLQKKLVPILHSFL